MTEYMRYTRFSFKNFKGIEEMTLDLSGPVTTLIGLNESGKTTILEAIFCFSYGAEDLEVINPEMASLRVPDQWIPISKRANFNETIEICAVVELSDDDQLAWMAHMRDEFRLQMVDVPTSITIREHYIFENSRYKETKRLWQLSLRGTVGQQRNPRTFDANTYEEWNGAVEYLKGRLPRIWYFPNFLFELPERFSLAIQDAIAGDEEKDKSRFYRSTFEQILIQLGSGANLQTHIVDRLGSSERADQRSLSAVLLDMGRVITTTIFDGWDRIFGRRPAAQEVELEASSDNGDAYLALRIKGPDGYYDLSERSLGFRWFFMFLLLTSFHGSDEDGPQSLFLLDEPASNLHSTAQAELLKSFEALVEKCNLVYTTHSHHLIDVRWLDSAYVVRNAALGSLDLAEYMTQRVGANTSVSAKRYRQFVADHPDQTSYFQPVLDLLDYRPSILEPVPNVVLVEGKSDFYLLRYAREILGLGADVKLVPGGGAGSLEPLVRLHIGWAKSFVILLDADAEGRKQQLRYESVFGPVLAGRCVLLPDMCGDPSVKEAEQLLDDDDRQSFIAAIFADGVPMPSPKKAFRQALLEIYARRQVVALGDRSRTRLTDLLDHLALTLAAQDPSPRERGGRPKP